VITNVYSLLSNPALATTHNTALSSSSSSHHPTPLPPLLLPLSSPQAAANALKDADLSQNSASSGSSDGLHEDGDGTNDDDVPAKDFAICALDVLSGTFAAVRSFCNRFYCSKRCRNVV
jgi:hypothetical protein